MGGKHIDLTGQRFGILTALWHTHKNGKSAWRLRCDCGREVFAQYGNLSMGKHKSCGCQRVANYLKSRGSLGVRHWPEYAAYRHWTKRLPFCDRWLTGEGKQGGFLCFIEDMGRRPDGMTLKRLDKSLPYQKGNCVWAPRKKPSQPWMKKMRADVEYVPTRLVPTRQAEGWQIAQGFGFKAGDWAALMTPPSRAVLVPMLSVMSEPQFTLENA